MSNIRDRLMDIPRPRDEVGRGEPAAARKDDLDRQQLEKTYDRGDAVQRARLRLYPTVDLDMADIYAGSVPISIGVDDLEEKLYALGFRNNPTAYVEVTDKFGPDDGSYAKQTVEPDTEFPHIGVDRPTSSVTWWNRKKSQYHATMFIDGSMDMIHLACHIEASAWAQPLRHVTVSEGNGMVGARDFRDFWYDEFGEELARPLGINEIRPKR